MYKKGTETFAESSIYCVIIIKLMTVILSICSMYSAFIIFFGILPTLIAFIIDQKNERYVFRIVFAYNCLGMTPYIIKILMHPSADREIINIIFDPSTWLIIYGSAAIGWLMYLILSQAIISINNAQTSIKIKQLEKELSELVVEWGKEVSPLTNEVRRNN